MSWPQTQSILCFLRNNHFPHFAQSYLVKDGRIDAASIQWNTEIPIDWIGLDDLHQQELSASLKIVLVEQRHVWLERDRKREKVEVLCLLGFLSTSLWGDLSATQPFPDSPTCVTRRLGNKLSKKTTRSTNFPKNGKQADQQSTRLLMQGISHRKCLKISQTNVAIVKRLRCVKRLHGKSMERAPLAP